MWHFVNGKRVKTPKFRSGNPFILYQGGLFPGLWALVAMEQQESESKRLLSKAIYL